MHSHHFCHYFNRALPVEAFARANVHQVSDLIQLLLAHFCPLRMAATGRLRPIEYLSTNLPSNCHGEVKSRTRALPRAIAQTWTWRHYSAFPITLLRHNDKQLAC